MLALTVTDLPLHPLVVHAAVVLVPLSVVLLLIAASLRSTRVQVGAVASVMALFGAVAFIVAHRSGTDLAAQVGTPEEHMAWADPALAAALTYAALCLAWYAAALIRRKTSGRSRWAVPAERVTRALAVAAGIIAVILTVLVGHTGAEAVWSGVN